MRALSIAPLGLAATLLGCTALSDFGYSFATLDASTPAVTDDGSAGPDVIEGGVLADARAAGDARSDDGAQAAGDGGCDLRETSELSCESGRDEDCDGLVDCGDPDCRQSMTCCPAPSFESGDRACSDGQDNDCDGQLDCADSGCSGVYACLCGPPRPEGHPGSPASCVNGNDDDCDRLVDCQEVACAPNPACCMPSGTQELGASCTDGLNNDCDVSGADCADPDCRVSTPGGIERESGAACKNELDDDCDGTPDCADEDCRTELECCVKSETVEVSCGDGQNNDCDAAGSDCADADCALSQNCCVSAPENSEKTCADGRDNDCDGSSDCADVNCRPFYQCCVDYLRDNGQALQPSEVGFCDDKFDNDCDGAPNCADRDCGGGIRFCGIAIEPVPIAVQ